MEPAPASSTTNDQRPPSSDPPPPATATSSLDPPPVSSAPSAEPLPVSSAAPTANPIHTLAPISSQIQTQTLTQTFEPQQQQQIQPQPQPLPQSLPQPSPKQAPPQPQQRPPPAIPRPRVPTQSMPGGGGGGIALGVPAGYSHHQRPQSFSPFSSFRPSNPFGSPSPSFGQPFGAMPRSSAGGPDPSSSSSAQPRPPAPSVQTIGMIGSLSTAPAASQMRPSGVLGQNQQRLGQPQVRSAPPLANQTLNSQKFPSHGGPRAPSLTPASSQSPAPQSAQSLQQQWMQQSQGKQGHAASFPTSYRPQMRPPAMQQRPQQQQQQQLPMSSHIQVSASQQQHQKQQLQQQLQQMQQQQQSSLPNQSQERHPPRSQQSLPPHHQAARPLVPATPKSSVQTLTQHGLASSANYNDPDELSNDIISRKRIRELVAQVDRSEKLRPEIEDDLLEIADDFVESIVTAACHLAKHRKSTTLEARDILLHVERHWNMNLPGFSGDEIKCYKKPSVNDVHKERLAMIKKSMVGTNDGSNAKTPSVTGGQAAANMKLHAPKTPAPTEA